MGTILLIILIAYNQDIQANDLPQQELHASKSNKGFYEGKFEDITFPEIVWKANTNPFEDRTAQAKLIQESSGKLVHPELVYADSHLTPTLYKVHDRVYVTHGFEANITFVIGDGGLIISDAGSTTETTREQLRVFREVTGNTDPIVALHYTHHHPDQWGGTKALIDIAEANKGNIKVIAHKSFMHRLLEESGTLAPIMGRRSSYAFGAILPYGAEGFINAGVSAVPKVLFRGEQSFAPPNILVDDLHIETIAGLTYEFFHTPGESPDHITAYIHELDVMVGGDTVQGETLPNLYTIRGAKYRDGIEWMNSIDRMRRYHASALTQHQGRSIVGKGAVENVMLHWRDAIKFMNDQTIRYMNLGYNMEEVAEAVKLPPHLRDHRYIRPIRGSEYQNAKNIYAALLGWFNGDPTEKAKPSFKKRAQLYVHQLGGRDAILASANKALAEKEYGWAADLTTWLVRVNSKDREAREIKSEALRQWAYLQPEPGWRHFALTAAYELKNGPLQMKGSGFMGGPELLVHTSILKVLGFLPIRLKSEEVLQSNLKIGISISDLNENYTMEIRKGIMDIHQDLTTNMDAHIKMNRDTFMKIFALWKLDPEDAITSGEVTTVAGNGKILIEILSYIENPYHSNPPIAAR